MARIRRGHSRKRISAARAPDVGRGVSRPIDIGIATIRIALAVRSDGFPRRTGSCYRHSRRKTMVSREGRCAKVIPVSISITIFGEERGPNKRTDN